MVVNPFDQIRRNQLQNELSRIDADLRALSSARERLVSARSRARTSRDNYVTVRNRQLSRELVMHIRVINRFEGLCANTLRAEYKDTITLLKPRENSVTRLMNGIDAQISNIDANRTSLQNRRTTVQSQINNLQ